MDAPPIRYAEAGDGVRIAYWTLGRGPAFVQLPPLPHSHIRAEWDITALRRMFEAGASELTVVRYDGRGTGLSERNVDDFSLDAMLLDLDAVLDAVGVEHAALQGNGNTAAVAVAYAARHPDRVSHLVLWSPVVDGSVPMNNPKLHAARQVLATDWDMFVQTVAHTIVGWSEPETARQFAEVVRAGITPSTLQAMVAAIHRFDVREELSRVACPTLVLHRGANAVVPLESAEAVAAAIPGAQLVLLEGDSAVPYLGDWRAVMRATEAFLDLPSSARSTRKGGRPLRLLSMQSDALSPREREIVGLVVRGMTNRQIAQELYLAEKTVENHIGRILVKLDLPSRTRLAAYAVEHGLTSKPA